MVYDVMFMFEHQRDQEIACAIENVLFMRMFNHKMCGVKPSWKISNIFL